MWNLMFPSVKTQNNLHFRDICIKFFEKTKKMQKMALNAIKTLKNGCFLVKIEKNVFFTLSVVITASFIKKHKKY